MKRFQLLFYVFQFVFLTSAIPQTQNSRFILAWYDYAHAGTTITTMTQRYKDIQTHNFNCVIMDRRLLTSTNGVFDPQYFQYASSNPSKAFMDSAYKYSIGIILTTPDNGVLVKSSWDDMLKIWVYTFYNTYNNTVSQQGLAYWGNHPALWGFHIQDEPHRAHIKYIFPYANDIKAFNPNLLRFVNLLPTYADISRFDYAIDLPVYIDSIQPNILSFDHYPIRDDINPNNPQQYWPACLFKNLDIISRKSVEYGIPFNYVLTSLGTQYPNFHPNSLVTSYLMYAGLFYGAKGLAHWNGPISFNSIPLQHRELIKNINKKILDYEDILLSLQFQSVYHKSFKSTIGGGDDNIPTTSKWQNFVFDPIANEIFITMFPFFPVSGSSIDNLAVSFFTDNFDNRYFWIFNKSLSSSENIQLNLVYGSSVVDVLSGTSCSLPQNAVIHFEPAEAKLFKFIPNENTLLTNTITENTTWKSKRVVYEKIEVAPSAVLTVTGTVYFSANASVIIHSGGKIIVDGGRLTSVCSGE